LVKLGDWQHGRHLNVHEAKTHLSQLLARVEDGEEIIISRHGRPVARLVPHARQHTPRQPGFWRGRVTVAADLDDFADADARDWYGS
jgi:prevent-host-death family protein